MSKKEKNLEDVIAEMKKDLGDDIIIQVENGIKKDITVISTGSLSLDIALGIGGVPKGRVVEIFGGESTGKTTLALHIAREAQKSGGVVAFIDAENALDLEYVKLIGVDVGKLLISQPNSAEQGLKVVETFVKSKKVDLVIVDSVAALSPRAEIEGEIGDATIGLQARLMSSTLRKLSKNISDSGTCVIFLNQVRHKIGGWGNPEITSGGLALKFYSSVRVSLKRGGRLKSKDEEIGQRIKATVVKNKVAPPFRSAEYDIYYNEGISYVADVLNLAVNSGFVKRTGAWFSYKDKKGSGFEGLKQIFEEDEGLLKELKGEVLNETLKKNG